MNRRQFLHRFRAPAAILGMSSLPLAIPAFAMAADGTPPSPIQTMKTLKIIGIGGAGGNLVEAIQRKTASDSSALPLQFAYVDLGEPSSWRFNRNGVCVRGDISEPLLSLDPLGAGCDVDFAYAAALRNRDTLQALVASTDVVCLVAGLGGGTGSGVSPIAARLAREAGVLPVAVVVMPFEFENRNSPARASLRQLQAQTELVVTISNEDWLRLYGEEATFDEVFRSVDHQVIEAVRRLVVWMPVVGWGGALV